MIKINLIPPEYIAQIDRKVLIAKVVLGVAVFAASVLMISLWHIGRSKSLESNLADLQQQMQVLQKDVDKVKEIEKQIAEVQKYLNSINSINKNRFIYTKFMQDLVADLPGTMWFTLVNTTLSGSTLKVTLAVNSNSAYDLAYWINSLELSDSYADVTVGAINVSDGEMGKRFTVPLTVTYNYK